MEAMIEYIVRLSQANMLLALVLIVGIFICLICIAVVDRKIGYMRKELDAIVKFHGIEIPQESPESKQKKKLLSKKDKPAGNATEEKE